MSAEEKFKQFKLLLSQSKYDFSDAEKDLKQAFLAVISGSQTKMVYETKVPLKEKENLSVQIIKTQSGKGLWVCGKTFSYKDQLKNLGGKWNTSKKAWIFSLEPKQQLLDLFNLTETDIGSEN
jgi:hypothetical protein